VISRPPSLQKYRPRLAARPRKAQLAARIAKAFRPGQPAAADRPTLLEADRAAHLSPRGRFCAGCPIQSLVDVPAAGMARHDQQTVQQLAPNARRGSRICARELTARKPPPPMPRLPELLSPCKLRFSVPTMQADALSPPPNGAPRQPHPGTGDQHAKERTWHHSRLPAPPAADRLEGAPAPAIDGRTRDWRLTRCLWNPCPMRQLLQPAGAA